MDAELKALCNATIAIAAPSSVSNYGQVTYAAASNVSAYVEEVYDEVLSADGEKVRTTHLVVIDTADATVTEHSRIWLSSANSGNATLARHPMSVAKLVDENGTGYHYEVML